MKKIRGVWLTTAASNVFDSKSNIVEAMQLLADTGFNTVFPVVWNNGYTLYPSATLLENFGLEISPAFAGRDILAEVIDAAIPLGLDVIPWFEYGFAASYKDNGGHILAKKPEWAGKDKDDLLLIKNDFVWMNALDLEVQDFLLNLFLEVANKYAVAGVQGDDRLPAMPSEGGYDKKTKALYRSQFGADPPRDSKDRDWLKWRANILTDFLERLYIGVKGISQDLIVSMSPSHYPFGFNEYLQDVPTWIDRNIVDIIHPQLYRRNLDDYKGIVDDVVDRFGQEKLSKIFPGVLTRIDSYQITSDNLWQAIFHNRRSGIRGEAIFFFESLRFKNNALAKFLKKNKYAELVYLQRGNIGDDIQDIQQKLKSKGYGVGLTDGRFGSLTKLAVEKFQLDNQLEIDGVIGPLTYAKLIT
jgi:Glycosyl hydrolase-like 10/Putative peptidoglycan binding domain